MLIASRKEICENLTSILSLENLRIGNKSLFLNSLDLFEKTNLDFEDCVLLSSLIPEDKLYSHDKGLEQFKNEVVIKQV